MLAFEQLEPLCGKAERFEAHLRVCVCISRDIRTNALLEAARERQTTEGSRIQTARPAKRARITTSPSIVTVPSAASSPLVVANRTRPNNGNAIRTPRPHAVGSYQASKAELSALSPEKLQRRYQEDFCRVLIGINAAWCAADNLVFRDFLGTWVDRPVALPNRRAVSGHVLISVVESVQEKVAKVVKGKMATGQCDGWKNVAKSALVSSVMTVDSTVSHSVP